jgi:hypothetical protein
LLQSYNFWDNIVNVRDKKAYLCVKKQCMSKTYYHGKEKKRRQIPQEKRIDADVDRVVSTACRRGL